MVAINESKEDFLSRVTFEDVSCPLCGQSAKKNMLFSAPDRYNGLPGIFFVSECGECGLAFQCPRPTEECIGLYYPDRTGYFNPGETKVGFLKKWLTENVLKNFFGYRNLGGSNVFLRLLLSPVYFIFFRHQSVPQYVRRGRLLDVGCSSGSKLKLMEEIGWDVSGIETNKKAVETGRRNGLDILHGSVFDIDLPDESFDVIILDMVLEHLYNPVKALGRITRWLKKDGQLIVTIPTFDGIEFKIYKDYAYSLHLPNHITFFGKMHLAILLNESYRSVKYVYQHFDRDFVASAFYRYREKQGWLDGIVSKSKIVRVLIIKPLSFIFSLLSMTSRMTVFARKRSSAVSTNVL